MKYDIIIIGAGCAGLMAMNELLQQGYRVCLLEATTSPGGRIATIQEKGFETPIETGAEFIHGRLPLTLKLLRNAGIAYQAISNERVGVRKGQWHKEDEHASHWDELLRKLRRQKKDTTIHSFLCENFPDPEYKNLRVAAQRFAEGFDLADIGKASILSVEKEWRHEDQKQFRIPGGYSQLIDYLLSNCMVMSGEIHFNTSVNTIAYRRGHTTVTTNDRRVFKTPRTIITVSMGVLQSDLIKFDPGLAVHGEAIRQIGFGSVIKFHLQFKNAFWEERVKNIGFLLTDESIPTWWTQSPVKNKLLTGWLGGPPAGSKKSEQAWLRLAIQSLSSIFHVSPAALKKEMLHHRISDWQRDLSSMGGYSYNTLFSGKAIEILSEPVAASLFFAGEAINTGESQGTVEAALQSGLAVAKKIARLDS